MSERIDITRNDDEHIQLIVSETAFLLVHDVYSEGRTWVMTLGSREARLLMEQLNTHLPGIERRCGVSTPAGFTTPAGT